MQVKRGCNLPSKIKVIGFSILCLVIMSQYTNCDNYEDYESNLHFNSGLCFEKGSCAEPSAENLQVAIRNTSVPVSKLNKSVVIMGDCSAGNFDSHIINYSYSANSGSKVVNSQLGGCVNGKFIIGMQMNSSGAASGEAIDFEMSIKGLDQSGRTISSTRPSTTMTFINY